MKFFYLCFILFPFFISCSATDSEKMPGSIISRLDAVPGIDTIPINKANPFDRAGQVHQELMTSYYYGDPIPFTLSGIVTTTTGIANASPSFMVLTKGAPYSFNASDKVAAYIAHPDARFSEAVNASLDAEETSTSFKTFVISLLSLCDTQEYPEIYKFITVYENEVLNDGKLTDHDKRVILITTSIARHSAYARKKKPKKNKDPDWLLLVGNITGAIDGANQSEADAVMEALVTGIVDNE